MFGLCGLILNISLVRACSGFTWRVSDCDELVGLLTGDEGIGNAFNKSPQKHIPNFTSLTVK